MPRSVRIHKVKRSDRLSRVARGSGMKLADLAALNGLGARDVLTVGYRLLWAHLEGRLTFAEAVAAAKKATRNLAKRQLTWLRSEPALDWIAGVENPQLAPIKSVLCDAASARPAGSL